MAVDQAARWRAEVSRFAPGRLAEFDELIADALNNPVPVHARTARAETTRGVRPPSWPSGVSGSCSVGVNRGHFQALPAARGLAGEGSCLWS